MNKIEEQNSTLNREAWRSLSSIFSLITITRSPITGKRAPCYVFPIDTTAFDLPVVLRFNFHVIFRDLMISLFPNWYESKNESKNGPTNKNRPKGSLEIFSFLGFCEMDVLWSLLAMEEKRWAWRCCREAKIRCRLEELQLQLREVDVDDDRAFFRWYERVNFLDFYLLPIYRNFLSFMSYIANYGIVTILRRV